jgi:hypothetical protein
MSHEPWVSVRASQLMAAVDFAAFRNFAPVFPAMNSHE